jgi:transposase-like protein
MIRIQYAENVQYKVCQVARLGLQGGDLAAHRLSFELLPAYIELFRRKGSRSHTHLEIDSRTNRFVRVFICPHQSRGYWLHLRRFIAADGTFLKGRFIQQLFLAVGIDANGNTLILAWAVVESENEDSWRYFFHHLIIAIPEISEEPTVFISDRDKGLGAADDELGENIIRAICAQHLKDNFTIKFSRTLKPLFWRIARGNSVARFNAIIEELRVVNPLAAQHLLNAQPEMWARAHFQGTQFGHDTSNVVESINKVLLIDRELPIVSLLNSLWNRIMDQRFKRLDLQ